MKHVHQPKGSMTVMIRLWRADFKRIASGLCIGILFSSCLRAGSDLPVGDPINREALVRRHIPVILKPDPLSPLTVGNGEFAFTVDVTGLQTFPDFYSQGIPLSTLSQWGWHSLPNPMDYRLDQTLTFHDAGGRKVGYASKQDGPAGLWLRSNPHRLHLGRIGFRIMKSDGSEALISDIGDVRQSLDLWKGIIRSSFSVDGDSVAVETACHPDADQVAARIRSPLFGAGRMTVRFDFAYGSPSWGGDGADWNNADKHASEILLLDGRSALIRRTLDADTVFVFIRWKDGAEFRRAGPHSFILSVSRADRLDFTCRFSKSENDLPSADADGTLKASERHWKSFWQTGGAVDLSGSGDRRAAELERRIILSRYLTAIQCAGSTPPQETGLTCNSWFGKFHIEMHWWHAVHFALWGHPELLEKSMAWYEKILPEAERTAVGQGLLGCRWPKMTTTDGRESPSAVGVFLIWQQPHPIYYAELLYRVKRDASVLRRYERIVTETASFMSSFARKDPGSGRYVLGPPVMPAQEITNPDSTRNPAFELSYWAYGLETAQRWRERLGLARVAEWDEVLAGLSPLPKSGGTYRNAESATAGFEDPDQRKDHPSLLGAFGMLPCGSIDTAAMGRTLEKVIQSWNWESAWGWDFPLMAMTAARIGRPDLAIDCLLMDSPRNRYLPNGHNFQDGRLPVYLPGNGGLLAAVAMMAEGWDGCPRMHAPGFPRGKDWSVRFEGLNPLP
jgi:protein-glucosylgalactosylhydroxylysine glucosidase